MSVTLLFFSTLRDRMGGGECQLEVGSPTPARQIFCSLFPERPVAERLLQMIRVAVNCEYVSPDTLVRDGDEVAFIPPVSGG